MRLTEPTMYGVPEHLIWQGEVPTIGLVRITEQRPAPAFIYFEVWRPDDPVHSRWVGCDGPQQIAALRHLATDRTGASCTWNEDSDGIYHTTCGNAFTFVVDGPAENGMRWCGYCGKALAVERRASDDKRKDGEQ